MDEAEIVRRLRALLEMAPDKRPISITQLEKIAGVADKTVYDICKIGRMQRKTKSRLEKALLLVENDQLVMKRDSDKRINVSIRDPQPKMVIMQRVEFTSTGPKVRSVAANPLSFPDVVAAKKLTF